MGNGATECEWRHALETRGGFGEIWKSQFSWKLDTKQERSTFGAHRGQTNLHATGVARDGGWGRWKSQNRQNVYLSPYVEEPLNSKVIKCFVPELRSRKCFSCFEIPMFYVYMFWTVYVRFTHIRIMGMVQLNCDTIVSGFELQSCYFVHFWTSALRKDMNPFILRSYGLNGTTYVFL